MGDAPQVAPSAHRKFLASLSRLLARHAIPLTPEQLSLAEGARAAVVTALLLVPVLWLHCPTLAWMAFAGFWTCLIDPGGGNSQRLRIFGSLTVAGAIVLCLSAWASQWGLPIIFAIIVLAGLATGFGRAGPPATAQLILLVAAVACAGTGFPRPFPEALRISASFAAGCVVASLFCLVLWRLYPYAAARRAGSAVYHALELMIAELASARLRETVHRQAVRNAIERARGLTAQIDAAHGNALMRVRLDAGLASAERLFTALLAIEHLFEVHGLTQARRTVLGDLARACRVAEGMALRVDPDGSRLVGLASALIGELDDGRRVPSATGDSFTALVRVCAEALLGFAHALARREGPQEQAGRSAAWHVTPAIGRHTVRLVVALVMTQGFCLWLDVSFAFWALIAALIVVQPIGASTVARSIERVIGSILGAGLAAGLAILLAGHLVALLGATAFLALCAIALRAVNYTLLVLFLTALFVLVAELVMPGDGFALYRAFDNSLGAVIGLLCALLLWPDRGQRDLNRMLREAIAGNLDYAALSIGGRDDAATRARIAEVQRSAGMVMVDAEFAQAGLPLLGGLGVLSFAGAKGRRASDILRALRRLSGEATLLRFDIATGFRSADPACAEQLEGWAEALRADAPDVLDQVTGLLLGGELQSLVSGARLVGSGIRSQAEGSSSDQAEPGQFPPQGGR